MTFSFAFGDQGDESKGELGLGLPRLAGASREEILGPVERAGTAGAFSLWRGPAALAGLARAEVGADVEGATRRLYAELLQSCAGLHLYRIWNCVPRINGVSPGGLENYRVFCKGRSLAFEEGLGREFTRHLPASTAVGTAGTAMTVVFLAGERPARHLENPAQMPAYEYPPEHGPRSPSFARASVVERDGGLDAFVSGTSAILGHSTVAPHDTAGQLGCTIDNLRTVFGACGLGIGGARHFKVYLRNPADLAAVAPRVERSLLSPGNRVTYLCADICRSALNVEIEATVRGASSI
jgi:hypothetical protein